MPQKMLLLTTVSFWHTLDLKNVCFESEGLVNNMNELGWVIPHNLYVRRYMD